MRRVAYCSPVNPVESGISDYSEELLPYLGQYIDITVFVDNDVQPTNRSMLQALRVEKIGNLANLHAQQPFDAILYHMGNSPAHSSFLTALQRLPGVVVLHDYVLHHLMLWHAANRLKNMNIYREAMTRRYGVDGTRVASMMERGQLSDAVFAMPLSESVIERATALIGHSRYVVERAHAYRPDLPTAVVPMGVPLVDVPERIEARELLGLPLHAPIWASFGHINPYKRVEQALRAFAKFRADYPDALYCLVGSVSPNYDLPSLVKRLHLGDSVHITGYVDHADFNLYVAAADICFNGRYPSAGETSASLLRLLGAGRAVLVSDIATFSELPRDAVAHVPVDHTEEATILAYAQRLWQDEALRHALEHNARTYVANEHSLDQAASNYVAFLSELYGWGDIKPMRDPLWDLNTVEMVQHDSVGKMIGRKAAELGMTEADMPLLNRVADRLRRIVS